MRSEQELPELLTASEVAAALRVTKVTVHRWSKDGTLSPIRLGSKAVRFRREDVAQLLRPEPETAA